MYAKLRNLNILPYKKDAFETYFNLAKISKKIKKHPPKKLQKSSPKWWWKMVMIYHGTRQKVTLN